MHRRPSQTAELADYASRLRLASIPDPVVERARQVILDTIGAMISGSRLEPGQAFLSYASELGRRDDASVVGSKLRLSAADAAFINGALAHADESDDSHTESATHPGCVVVPAALAACELRDLGGAALIESVVAGYDVECRVSKAMQTLVVTRRGFSTFGVCGCFGAAASAGHAIGLDEDHMVGALGLAALQSSGLWAFLHDSTHFAKALQVGFGTYSGITAALLAARRSSAPIERIFEGPQNVIAAFSDEPKYGELTADLGARFEIMGTSLKKHVCGGPIRWAVDGLLELMTTNQLGADDLEEIDVRMAHSSVDIVGPTATIPAISLRHVMAIAAIDGFVGVDQTHSPQRLNDPRALELQKSVRLAGDDDLQKLYPTLTPAIVTLSLRDGRRLTTRVDFAAGTKQNPLTRAEVEEKFLRLAGDIIGVNRAKEVAATVWKVDEVDSLRHVLEPVCI